MSPTGDAGAPQEPPERVTVLLHGFTHTGASWDRVRAELPPGYRAIAPDLRGHGSAAEAEPVGLEPVLEDLEALVPERFTLAGYSMGGRIAVHAALHPGLREHIERLVLIGASPGLAEPAERLARREADLRLADEIEHMDIAAFAARWADVTSVLAGQPEEVRAEADRDRRRNSPSGLARALRGLGTGALPSAWHRLGELAVPVVLAVGERDVKFRAVAEAMMVALPSAELVVVPGAGHSLHLEAPRRIAALLASGH